jgi:ABC-type uncharacterized transport system ATPase subunit
MAIALKLEVPWDRTNVQHSLLLELLDEDGDLVMVPGPEEHGEVPLQVTGEFEAGRPPGIWVPQLRHMQCSHQIHFEWYVMGKVWKTASAPNGAGKSTTLHMLTTLLPPTAGTGRVAGYDTVFLTTQYLEEADVLADHVGIIDHGKIVAEGTPAALKAEIGRPTVEVVPADPEDRPAFARVLAGFGELTHASRKSVSVRLDQDEYELADVVRALDSENLHVANLQLHAPSLDDVFLAKTGRTLEGAGAGQPETVGA